MTHQPPSLPHQAQVEAAAKALSAHAGNLLSWEQLSEGGRENWRTKVRLVVTAALSVPHEGAEEWQLVPKVATEEMQQAALREFLSRPNRPRGHEASNIFRAMLAAAPQPPSSDPTLPKRPVAFRYKNTADEWVLTLNAEEAQNALDAGHDAQDLYQGLYVRDGNPQPPSSGLRGETVGTLLIHELMQLVDLSNRPEPEDNTFQTLYDQINGLISDYQKSAYAEAKAPSASAPEQWRTMESGKAAALCEALMEQTPYNKQPWARVALAIAARAIRRGRHLTPTEQLENMAKAFEEEGSPEIAEKIRGRVPLTHPQKEDGK